MFLIVLKDIGSPIVEQTVTFPIFIYNVINLLISFFFVFIAWKRIIKAEAEFLLETLVGDKKKPIYFVLQEWQRIAVFDKQNTKKSSTRYFGSVLYYFIILWYNIYGVYYS